MTATDIPFGDRLEAMYDELQAKEHSVAPRERVTVVKVLLECIGHNIESMSAARIRGLIGPIVCTNSEQILPFKQAFDAAFDIRDDEQPLPPFCSTEVIRDRRRKAREEGPLIGWFRSFFSAHWRKITFVVGIFVLLSAGLLSWKYQWPDFVKPWVEAWLCSTSPKADETQQLLGVTICKPNNPIEIVESSKLGGFTLGNTSKKRSPPTDAQKEKIQAVANNVLLAIGAKEQASLTHLAGAYRSVTSSATPPLIYLLELTKTTGLEPQSEHKITGDLLAKIIQAFIKVDDINLSIDSGRQIEEEIKNIDSRKISKPAEVQNGTVSAPAAASPSSTLIPLVILLFFGSALLWWWLGRGRRLREYLQRGMPKTSPLVHEMVIGAGESLTDFHKNIGTAVASLVRPGKSQVKVLSIDKTIERTINKAGYFSPVLEHQLRQASYLALISTRGPDDQEAESYDRLVRELRLAGLQITRYWIDHQLDRCFMNKQERPIRFLDLAEQFRDYRLIYFGRGEIFLTSGTRKARPIAKALELWEEKAFVSAVPANQWGLRELTLTDLFGGIPKPATSRGLKSVADQFEAPQAKHLPPAEGSRALWSWLISPERWIDPAPPDKARQHQLLEELKAYFAAQENSGHEAFHWLCACSLYPEITWDLTLLLGLKLQGNDAEMLYSESRAELLSTLPWFEHGFMPSWLRRALLGQMDKPLRETAVDLIRRLIEEARESFESQGEGVRLIIGEEKLTRIEKQETYANHAKDMVLIEALAEHRTSELTPFAPERIAKPTPIKDRRFRRGEYYRLAVIFLYGLGALFLAAWPSDGAALRFANFPLIVLALTGALVGGAYLLVRRRKRAERTEE